MYDPNNTPVAPTFYPTMEEFKDFAGYLTKCEKTVGNIGIFKVVAPKKWVPRKSGYDNMDLVVRKPIEQNVHGTKGIYELVYFIKESKPVERFKKMVIDLDKLTDGKSDLEIESLFWKTLKHSAPIYGADVLGTIFDKNVPWNLSEIESLLTSGLKSEKISGVNMPYIYVGSWKTMFGWHTEDMDLYSINYMHSGKPKYWYSIDLDCNEKFEKFMKYHFPDNFKECS
jgi:jumonji domain-containing protein 2